MMNNGTTTEQVPCLNIDGEKIPLQLVSNDALYSARNHAWREVFMSINPKNQFGQSYRTEWRPYAEVAAYKQRMIEQRGIPEMEAELFRRGLDPKNKDYKRVAAGFATF
jgi:hypothetical protein